MRPSASVIKPEPLDVVALVVAHLVALLSFRAAFAGPAFFVAGAVGTAVAAAYWTLAFRAPVPSLLRGVGAVAAFAIFGPVAADRTDAAAGFLPSPVAVGATFSGAIRGWRTLVTTLPPVGDLGHVLVVPYLCGFVGVSASILLLRSTRSPVFATVPPIAMLGLGVLVGTNQPGSLFVEAGLLLAIVLLWASTLDRRARPVLGEVRRHRGRVSSVALLAVVVVGAGTLGSHVPYAGARSRYVLRDHIEPPFDPTQYPSPLAGFRKYRVASDKDTPNAPNKKTDLLTIGGLTQDTRMRIAVMDDYDGLVWRVAANGGLDAFRQTGTRLPGDANGNEQTIRIKIQGLKGVWLPLIGQPTRIEFGGKNAGELEANLRYNVAQSAAAVPGELHPGDRFELHTVIAKDADVDGSSLARQAAGSDPAIFSAFADKAGQIGKNASDQLAQARLIAARFKNGSYDDGPTINTPPGHFLARMSEFLREPKPVGNGEQYAAAAAILLRARQIPARVVLGLKVTPKKREYTYDDVQAWVEIPVAQKGWVAYDVTPDTSNKPKPKPLPPKDPKAGPQPPPQPPRAALSASSGSAGAAESKTKNRNQPKPPEKPGGNNRLITLLGLACIPLLIFGGPILLILGLKRRRRNQRRRAPTPALQIAGGWDEVVDFLRDLGRPVPATATRRELASTSPTDGLRDFATRVDTSMFSAREPSPDDAQMVWSEAAGIRQSLAGSVGTLDRVRCALSITSLRPGR